MFRFTLSNDGERRFAAQLPLQPRRAADTPPGEVQQKSPGTRNTCRACEYPSEIKKMPGEAQTAKCRKAKAPRAKHVPGLRRSAGYKKDARCGRKKPAAAGERGHGKTTRVCRHSKKQEKPFILFLQAFQEQQMTQRFPCGDNLQALDQHPRCTGSAAK